MQLISPDISRVFAALSVRHQECGAKKQPQSLDNAVHEPTRLARGVNIFDFIQSYKLNQWLLASNHT